MAKVTPTYLYAGKILQVKDGDTIKIEIDLGFNVKVTEVFRLLGVNCPESKGPEKPLGFIAKNRTNDLAMWSPQVTVETYKDDSFGRWLAKVYLLDGSCLNDILISEGFAVAWDGKGERPKFDIEAAYPLVKST